MADPVLIHARNAKAAGAKYHIDPAILLGLLSVEGGTGKDGRPVRPGDGAGPASYGQFTTGTGQALGIHYGNSKSEVDGVARYLNQLGYQKTPALAIAKYNGGPGNPQPDYARKVISASKRYGASSLQNAPAGSSSPVPATKSGGLFDAGQQHGMLYALLFVATLLTGAVLVGVGLNHAAGGAPARAAAPVVKKAAKTAAVAAVA
jgi:hypothetical protein